MRLSTFPSLAAAVSLLLILALRAGAQKPLPDTPFWQDYHEGYPLATPEENDVRAVVVDRQGRVWAATAAGVRYLERGAWHTPPGGSEAAPAYCLYGDPIGLIWVGASNGIYRAMPGQVAWSGLSGIPVSAISGFQKDGKRTIVAAGPDGIWRGAEVQGWTKAKGSWNRSIRSVLAMPDGGFWVGSASGLYRVGPDGASVRYSRPNEVLSSSILNVTPLPDRTIAVGSSGGIDVYRGAKRLRSLSVRDGMPARDARSIARDASGRLWMATSLGVVRYDIGKWSFRHSRRWLQSDDARDVAIGPDGTAWVATGGGVDAIRRKRMTLSDKADTFLKMLRARHIREPGLVGPAVLAKPGDLSQSFIEDDDNDGEHTGMFCAMESMRYAVTKALDAKANARAAFHALMVLQRATGTKHFIARSVLPLGTAPRHEVDRTFTPQEIAESRRDDPREKIIEKRWLPSADGKWLWKRDASSDEVVGHMFGYAVYYDLAADEDERRLVRDQVDRIVGGIVDHGFVLQDIDGKATRWGNWSPASLNGDPNWFEEKCGNSTEILAHLGIAYHVTGKEKYRTAARDLISKHGYLQNVRATRFDTPSERTHINDELLSMVYPNLLSHPVVPEMTSAGRQAMRQWHVSCRADQIPFYDFVYNRFSGKSVPLGGAVETLREWPLDMVEWTVDNSRREDVAFDRTPGLDPGRLTRILPRSEMGICMWDQEPYRAVLGRGGDREDKPTDWLLAYWMGRHYGLLAAPAKH